MSKEQDFRKLIAEQNREEQDALWLKLEQRQDEEVTDLGEVLVKNPTLKKRVIIAVGAFVCFLAILAIALVCTMTIKKESVIRYCTGDDYEFVNIGCPIEQYASENGKEILYFDWYEDSEYYFDQQYKLKSTGEVICLREGLIDENGVLIVQNVTDKNTELDVLDFYKTSCIQSVKIKSCEVKYSVAGSDSKAYFSYKNYTYYLSADTAESDYILDLVENLIK